MRAVFTLTLLSSVGCLLPVPPATCAEATAPPLLLANVFRSGEHVLSDYWVSEKYDGVRAYWDGQRLLTRRGTELHAPSWFTANWPVLPLDGELWIGRGRFQEVIATVRDRVPNDAAWREVKFMVFDLPTFPGVFTDRSAALQALLQRLHIQWLRAVEQHRGSDEETLLAYLDQLVDAGAEGLMLHRANSLYQAARNDDLLKLKRFTDAEARVVGYTEGKGKYTGLTGALVVETAAGTRFRIGSGLTDAQRRHPPPIGSWITYSFQGMTASGIPRFATFVRLRDEL